MDPSRADDWFRNQIGEGRGVDALAQLLLDLLNSGLSVWHDGSLYFVRARVTRLGRLSLEIYPRDHPPPHFHVRCPDFEAKLAIADCSLIRGSLDRRDHEMIRWFFDNGGRERLEKLWRDLRPGEVATGEGIDCRPGAVDARFKRPP